MKITILDTQIDRLTAKPTSQPFIFIFFQKSTNFLIQFFSNAQPTPQKKMKECFRQRFKPQIQTVSLNFN
ncbi:MAG: hypothetical protein IPG18_12320 [Saprospiraceae bacterium]|nr:hypothetical protein [Saprospiraceae bacterium]